MLELMSLILVAFTPLALALVGMVLRDHETDLTLTG